MASEANKAILDRDCLVVESPEYRTVHPVRKGIVASDIAILTCPIESDLKITQHGQARLSTELIIPDTIVHRFRVVKRMSLPSL